MRLASFELIPRDGIFCKDACGWYTSASGRGRTLAWPWPSTIRGALRGAVGRAIESELDRVLRRSEWPERTADVLLGASLAIRRPQGAAAEPRFRLWPAPADATLDEAERPLPLVPRRLACCIGGGVKASGAGTNASQTSGQCENAGTKAFDLSYPSAPPASGKLTPARGFWTEESFCAWLSSWPPSAKPTQALNPPRRLQVHTAIDADTQTAREQFLYSHEVLEPLELGEQMWRWTIAVQASLKPDLGGRLLTLGSDSRLAWLENAPDALFQPPQCLLESFREPRRALRLILVTHASFAHGWLPDGFTEHDGRLVGALPGVGGRFALHAAAVPRPQPVSGWDMEARRPKRTDRTVPAGSVYYLECLHDSYISASDIGALWLAAIGRRQGEGFGRFVPAVYEQELT
jgi:CRISPR-associated protein Cmr3